MNFFDKDMTVERELLMIRFSGVTERNIKTAHCVVCYRYQACVRVCVRALCVRFQCFRLTTQGPNTTDINLIYTSRLTIQASHLPVVLFLKMKTCHVQTVS